MTLETRFELGGLVLVGQPIPWGAIRDKHFMVTHNWHEPGSAKSVPAELAVGHGAHRPEETLRGSVLITIEGWSWGSSRARWQLLRDELTALGAVAGLIPARLLDGGESTWRMVQVVKVTPRDDRATNRTHWAIDLRAPDPRRYSAGEMITSGVGRVEIVNAGRAPVSPRMQITGTTANTIAVTEDETGRQVWFTNRGANGVPAPLAASDVLELDPADGSARINGALKLGLTRTEWPEVPPAGRRNLWLNVAGRLTVEQRSAWW